MEDRIIELKDETETPILRSTFGQRATDTPLPALQNNKKTKALPMSKKIREAKQVLMPPQALAQDKPTIGKDEDTSILTRNVNFKSVSNIPLDVVDKK